MDSVACRIGCCMCRRLSIFAFAVGHASGLKEKARVGLIVQRLAIMSRLTSSQLMVQR